MAREVETPYVPRLNAQGAKRTSIQVFEHPALAGCTGASKAQTDDSAGVSCRLRVRQKICNPHTKNYRGKILLPSAKSSNPTPVN
jgi:hypothetical protein